MREEENDMRQNEEDNVIIQDSVSLYYYSKTNTPYTGSLCYLPGYGYLAYSNYVPVCIPLVLTADSLPNRDNESKLSEALSNAAFATGLTSFLATGSATLQANELFYWDEITGKFELTIKAKGNMSVKLEAAVEMSKVGKIVGKAASWVSVVVVGGQVAVDGFGINTGTDAVVCAIGFIPGVGWVISEVYGISNAIVTGATGKTIPEHTRNRLFEKYHQFLNELGRWMTNLTGLPEQMLFHLK